MPPNTNDEVDEDPTGNKALWDRGLLNGASQKVILCGEARGYRRKRMHCFSVKDFAVLSRRYIGYSASTQSAVLWVICLHCHCKPNF